jgi:hypothetical protein
MYRFCKTTCELGTPQIILGGLVFTQGVDNSLQSFDLLALGLQLSTVLGQKFAIFS